VNDQALPVPVQQSTVYYPIDALERMAQAIAKSNLFGMKSQEQALALMLTAQAEGQHPATITQDYDIIQGRPARKTHSVLARFQHAGGKVEWLELTDKKARASFSHRSGGTLEIEWTLEMATKAGLAGKDNWKHYPRAMLRSRCIAEGIRAVFPGAIGGMLVAEEAQDLPPAIVGSFSTVTGENLEEKWVGKAKEADSVEALEVVWKDGCAELEAAKAKDAYLLFKQAVNIRKAELAAPPQAEAA
jgi:hypothetical protein